MASRIDLVAGAPLQVRGTVQTLDASAQTFRINDLTIDYERHAGGSALLRALQPMGRRARSTFSQIELLAEQCEKRYSRRSEARHVIPTRIRVLGRRARVVIKGP
jgi:hypothetical protein